MTGKFNTARAAAIMALALAPAARAAEIVRVPNANGAAPIAAAVVVPAGSSLMFLSGSLASVIDPKAPAGSVAAYGDTKAQAISILEKHKALLAAQRMSFADVVQAHVFLAGDPSKGGDIDFAGLNAAWSLYFGTAAQPNKPARSTVKVAALVQAGALVEIEMTAAKAGR